MADQRNRRPGVEREVEVLEHGPTGQVRERDVLEADRALSGRELDGAGPVAHVLRLVEDLEDPLARRRSPLRLADPHPERAERHDEHREEEVERDERADAERAVRDHPRADEQHARLRQERQEGQERHVGRALPVRPQRLPEQRLVAHAELRLLRRLLRERLDHVDADDVLLDDRRHVGELLLDVAKRRVRDPAVAIGDRDEQRHHREHDEGEPPLDEEEDDAHGHDGERVLEEEDQAVAEEEADALEVDRRTRHQLPGLVAVVEAEREPDEVRVEALAQVHLHVEGLFAGDEPTAAHERRRYEAEGDDRSDVEPELMRVVVLERPVDHVLPRHPDQRDLAGLGADREHDRDQEAALVRLEE